MYKNYKGFIYTRKKQYIYVKVIKMERECTIFT